MNNEAARQGGPDSNSITCADDSNGFGYWTAADDAELDVLVYELARHSAEHRDHCEACKPCPVYEDWRRHLDGCPGCRGDAPLTLGPPCPRRADFIAHGDACKPCNPCPTLTRLAEIAVDWRNGRVLRSKAEWLRKRENQQVAA